MRGQRPIKAASERIKLVVGGSRTHGRPSREYPEELTANAKP
ncbi:MAG: hypothetical protein V1735_01785 [Nanoarchaeota archaeon]